MKHAFLKVSMAAAIMTVALPASAQTLVTYLGPDENSSPVSHIAATTTEEQSAWNSFLFGSDYKNVGVIRNKLARTDKRIDYLVGQASSTEDAATKAGIETEIDGLVASEKDMIAFIGQNESKFSLFGWFVKYVR